MTPSRQIEEMAKLDGWTHLRIVPPMHEGETEWLYGTRGVGRELKGSEISDYLTNGDAARAVARKLPHDRQILFVANLVAGGSDCIEWHELFELATKSGAEITQAVLRAARKWEEK